MPESDRVEDTGAARATGGGQANTGLQAAGDERPAQIARSGDATADGPGSVANAGLQRRRRVRRPARPRPATGCRTGPWTP
jgi:hypothetical protein